MRNATTSATTWAERSLAPDLARGFTLLFIALANVLSYLYGRPVAGPGWRPIDGNALDRSLDLLVALFVSERSFPLFAILLGYGLATMSRRLADRGVAAGAIRRVLVRRQLGLLVFGAVHTALLFNGDILGLYGITGLMAMLLLGRSATTRTVWALVSIALLTGRYAIRGTPGVYDNPGVSPDYLSAAWTRLADWSIGSVLDGCRLMMLGLVLIGVQLSRSGLLDRPSDHRTALRRLAVAGLAANLLVNLPYALAVARVWAPTPDATSLITAAHALSGVPTGLAYLSLFALLAVRLRDRPRSVLRAAIEDVGQRSLTCYLAQSLVLAPLLSPWGLGLGRGISTSTAYLIATAAWLFTVALAGLLARRGWRGPAEVALRALTYGGRRSRGPRVVASDRHQPAAEDQHVDCETA